MKPHILFAALVLATTAHPTATASPESTAAAASHWAVSEDLQITRILPDVWVHTSWKALSSGQRFPSNGLIVREDDALVLVDTAWGVAPTAQLMDWIGRELRLPVARSIATHFHDDRLGGWPVLAKRGIPLVALPMTLELAAQEKVTQRVDPALAGLREDESVRVGSIEIYHPGHAHSADNLVVWLPRQRLLFGGCAVKSTEATTMGNVADADLDAWQRAMQRLLARYPQAEIVVPGHQDSGGRELIEHTLELLKAHAG